MIKEDIEKARDIIGRRYKEQKDLYDAIKKLDEVKREEIKNVFIKSVDNAQDKIDKLQKAAKKYETIDSGKYSRDLLQSEMHKTFNKVFDSLVSKRFFTDIVLKSTDIGKLNCWGWENQKLIVNKKGLGFIPRYGAVTNYITDGNDLLKVIQNYDVRKWVFKRSKKDIMDIIYEHCNKMKPMEFLINDKVYKGHTILCPEMVEDRTYGLTQLATQTKSVIQLSTRSWSGWCLELKNTTGYGYSSIRVPLDKKVDTIQEIILAQLPEEVIDDIILNTDNLHKVVKKNWREYDKMKEKLKPYIFAYEV